jgi:hypothetical protein
LAVTYVLRCRFARQVWAGSALPCAGTAEFTVAMTGDFGLLRRKRLAAKRPQRSSPWTLAVRLHLSGPDPESLRETARGMDLDVSADGMNPALHLRAFLMHKTATTQH